VNGHHRSLLSQCALFASILGVIFAIIIPLYSRNSLVPTQVQNNSSSIDSIEKELRHQKICTESDQEACINLFERLANNITPAQQHRLACLVLRQLNPNISTHQAIRSGCSPRQLSLRP
jgi:hypothetical protein